MDENAFFQDLLLAVEQQLRSPQTPYVAKTFTRLTSQGMSEKDAKEQIAACLGEETDTMYRRKAVFDEKRYRTLLENIDPSAKLESDEEE